MKEKHENLKFKIPKIEEDEAVENLKNAKKEFCVPFNLVSFSKFEDFCMKGPDTTFVIQLILINFHLLYSSMTSTSWIKEINSIVKNFVAQKYVDMYDLRDYECIKLNSTAARYFQGRLRDNFLSFFAEKIYKIEKNGFSANEWLDLDKIKKELDNQRKLSPVGHNDVKTASRNCGIPYHKALNLVKKLGQSELFKYSLGLAPKLSPENMRAREDFCRDILIDNVARPEEFIMSDESAVISFPKLGNLHCWASRDEKPEKLAAATSHSWSLQVFAAVGKNFKSRLQVLGDEGVFERNSKYHKVGDRKVVPFNVNAENYQNRILTELNEDFKKSGLIEQTANGPKLKGRVFQQDGAPPHTCSASLGRLEDLFGLENICGTMRGSVVRNRRRLFTRINWPPYSPDLSILDFAVWPLLKKLAILKTPNGFYHSPAHAKDCLLAAWDEITIEQINNMVDGFTRRLERCYVNNGGYAG